MKETKLGQQNGFSIIEILAAISIIVLGMIGLLSLSLQSLTVINSNREVLTAGELAREGLELIKNKRDTNWLAGNGWLTGLANGNYIMSYDDTLSTSVADISVPATTLYIDANGYYSHHSAGGAATIFKRLISITGSSVASTTVTSLVKYQIKGATKQYKLVTVLYDWK